MEILDPLHGLIEISEEEKIIIDTPLFQRLRWIKQLGFSELTFPGASHTRYIHSIGTMHLATKAFSNIAKSIKTIVKEEEEKRILAILRLAALLHDIGHPPFSHAAETILPSKKELIICENSTEKATHEDITLYLILSEKFKNIINNSYKKLKITAEDVACILKGGEKINHKITINEWDLTPLLRQIISSEVDVDRMDYLLRDSYFTGVKYGNFDKDWLLSNIGVYQNDKKFYLSLNSKAKWTFEDFLLSRYHMFLMVYFHYKTVIYEKMFHNFLNEEKDEIILDLEKIEKYDDQWMMEKLKNSKNFWAKKITERKPLKMVLEVNEKDFPLKRRKKITKRLKENKIKYEWISSEMVLSKYYGKGRKSENPIFVRDERSTMQPRFYPIDEYSDLFKKYDEKIKLLRLYCDEEKSKKIKNIIERMNYEP